MRIQYADPDPGGKIVREKQKKYKEIGSNRFLLLNIKEIWTSSMDIYLFFLFMDLFQLQKTFHKVICFIKI